ncbi:MAG: M48 family metalloprotease [Acidobacteria bacterium]|nr:M48 family metalloprotease [Acidobacteriota bacterium]
MTAVTVLALLLAPLARAERTPLKPGWNLFSPEQDVEAGQQVSRDAERQLPMLNNSRVDNYLNNLGRRLADRAPGEKFPYRFKAVNDSSINAFALPGGPIYIHRGVIEAADNEAQLAGVIAHEISHVALRHGTNQASKAYVAQMPLSILGNIVGSQSIGAVLTQIGAGFAVNSVLLKYSRTAETQADTLGTQILYDAGYDPRAMAQFFEKIQGEGGGRSIEFFSNHPNPGNRIVRVNEELDKLGPQRGYVTESREFTDVKNLVRSLSQAKGQRLQSSSQPGNGRSAAPPERPSGRFATFQGSLLRMNYPDNWQAFEQGNAVTIAPRGGVVDDGRGNQGVAYGVVVNLFSLSDRYGRQLQPRSGSLEQATDQLIEDLQRSNPDLRVLRSYQRINVGGERALSTFLSNASPLGGVETNWLVTVQRPQGLLFIVFTAPERDFRNYEGVFREMLYSVRPSV